MVADADVQEDARRTVLRHVRMLFLASAYGAALVAPQSCSRVIMPPSPSTRPKRDDTRRQILPSMMYGPLVCSVTGDLGVQVGMCRRLRLPSCGVGKAGRSPPPGGQGPPKASVVAAAGQSQAFDGAHAKKKQAAWPSTRTRTWQTRTKDLDSASRRSVRR